LAPRLLQFTRILQLRGLKVRNGGEEKTTAASPEDNVNLVLLQIAPMIVGSKWRIPKSALKTDFTIRLSRAGCIKTQ